VFPYLHQTAIAKCETKDVPRYVAQLDWRVFDDEDEPAGEPRPFVVPGGMQVRIF
jgi:hypothetical protein